MTVGISRDGAVLVGVFIVQPPVKRTAEPLGMSPVCLCGLYVDRQGASVSVYSYTVTGRKVDLKQICDSLDTGSIVSVYSYTVTGRKVDLKQICDSLYHMLLSTRLRQCTITAASRAAPIFQNLFVNFLLYLR